MANKTFLDSVGLQQALKELSTKIKNTFVKKTDFDNLASVAKTGNYSDLNGKPQIPEGTITEIIMNGKSQGTSGQINLGTVLTQHQSLDDYVKSKSLNETLLAIKEKITKNEIDISEQEKQIEQKSEISIFKLDSSLYQIENFANENFYIQDITLVNDIFSKINENKYSVLIEFLNNYWDILYYGIDTGFKYLILKINFTNFHILNENIPNNNDNLSETEYQKKVNDYFLNGLTFTINKTGLILLDEEENITYFIFI